MNMLNKKFAFASIAGFLLILISLSHADVWTSVYYADGISPLPRRDPNIPDVYVDIMVGTHLSIVVSSNAYTVLWYGELSINDPDALRGRIWPCDYNDLTY